MHLRPSLCRPLLGLSLLAAPALALAQAPAPGASTSEAPAAALYAAPPEAIARLRDEGLNRSQAMRMMAHLCDVIGPRLSGSPGLLRANEWTRATMASHGLQNARLEAWGPFGRGWELQRFEARVTAPAPFIFSAYPKAWSPPTPGPVAGEVVYLDARRDVDLAAYRGKLRGKIVLIAPPREVKPEFEPLATRYTDDELARLADPTGPAPVAAPAPASVPASASAPAPSDAIAVLSARGRAQWPARRMAFLRSEGALALVDNSAKGSGGTIFVAQATAPQDAPLPAPDFRGRTSVQAYHRQAQARMLPQVMAATEDYNRLARLVQGGQKVTLSLDIGAKYFDGDGMCFNTVADIPGGDKAEEVVMVGAHLDSWHAATGATDNAFGVAVAMEAARIIQASGLKPRRTIRVALWTGEEQGLFGSSEFVRRHLAELPSAAPGAPPAPASAVTKKAGHDNFAAYFNLDNGAGKIRGIYSQGNAAAAPLFAKWLEPLRDLGATTVAPRNTGSTDHIPFDRVGLPGFQFIQDRLEYFPRTHHSNQDVLDRVPADDLKQAATVMAAFAYQAAMMDEKMPRKAQ